MRWTSDDFDSQVMGGEMAIPDYPTDIELMGFFNDPLIAAEFDGLVTDAELMGIDFDDPELMGAFLSTIIKKIKGRIQERKKARAASGQPSGFPNFSVSTGDGSAQLGPGGLSWTGPQAVAAAGAPAAGGIADMLKNPLVLAGIGGGVLLLIMLMKKKGA